uniref:SAC3_GANP domain-containing protein n=1 Tax=Rhabditophanes sp. KR3021 TaxID=114890 RepID=A0AC35TTZ1_9BILA
MDSTTENPCNAWINAERALEKIGGSVPPPPPSVPSQVNPYMGLPPPGFRPYNTFYQNQFYPSYSGNIQQPGGYYQPPGMYSHPKVGLGGAKSSISNQPPPPPIAYLPQQHFNKSGGVITSITSNAPKRPPVPEAVQNFVDGFNQQRREERQKAFFQPTHPANLAPGARPIKFNPNPKLPVGLMSSVYVDTQGCDSPLLQQVALGALRQFIIRAYKTLPDINDKGKLIDYLEKRIRPLLSSGATHAVKWDEEPMPHEVGYQLTFYDVDKKRKLNKNGFINETPYHQNINKGKKRKGDGEGLYSKFNISSPPKKGNMTSSAIPDILISSNMKVTKKNKKAAREFESMLPVVNDRAKSERAKRFGNGKSFYEDEEYGGSLFYTDKGKIKYGETYSMEDNFVGTCQDLEKRYLRLTEKPLASQVRPEHVLKKSISLVISKYRENKSYDYAGGQLKSIRQDLTVQRIDNKFAIYVYEQCALIAIENNDKEEFNQSQQQLRRLYELNPGSEREFEFCAYNLLFLLYVANAKDINNWMSTLTAAKRCNPFISFALSVYHSFKNKVYTKLFDLYENCVTPTAKNIMNVYLDRERSKALTIIFNAFRPSIPIKYISSSLKMSLEDTHKWIITKKIESTKNGSGVEVIDCVKFKDFASK